jgi:GT2 family glycosyltransferase
MTPISFVVPSYNNLRYLKNAYKSIRKYAGPDHEIIVLDDASSDGTVEWLRTIQDDNLVIWQNTNERLGHTITYNIGGRMAKNPIFTILHADMFIGPNYVQNALKHLKPGTVVSATRIEPPLHPEGNEKIVRDFGMWPETFMEKEFLTFVEQEQRDSLGKTTRGIFAPWFIHRDDFLRIGGHDELFAPFPYEDSDIFQRFVLAGYEIVQSRDALVYHLTCRGHKWTDDKEIGKVDQSYNIAEVNARKNYLRKWNSWIKNDEYHYPVVLPKYDTCAVLTGTTDLNQLSFFEPWFGRVIVENEELVSMYVKQEQLTTKLSMRDRVLSKLGDLTTYDVYVTINVNSFTREDFTVIQHLGTLLNELEHSDTPEGEYELGNIHIKINRLKNTVHELIKC